MMRYTSTRLLYLFTLLCVFFTDTDCNTFNKSVIVNVFIVIAAEGEAEISESDMEMMMEAFEMQCHANLQQAIRTVDGLGIEYDENVVCDICRSVCQMLCHCEYKIRIQ